MFFLQTGQILVILVNQFRIQFRWNECPQVNLIWLLKFVQEQSMHFPIILKFAIFLKVDPILMRFFPILPFYTWQKCLSDFQNKWVIKTNDSSTMIFENIPAYSWIWSGKLPEILFISGTSPHSFWKTFKTNDSSKKNDSSTMMFWNIPAYSWIWSGKLPKILFISETRPRSFWKKYQQRMQINGEILDEPLVQIPFRMIVSGSTGVGKTYFCRKFLSSKFVTKPTKVYYFYNDFYETSPEIWRIKGVPFSPFPGLPTMEFFRSIEQGSVVVIDDQYKNCIKSKGILNKWVYKTKLYLKLSHLLCNYYRDIQILV